MFMTYVNNFLYAFCIFPMKFSSAEKSPWGQADMSVCFLWIRQSVSKKVCIPISAAARSSVVS